jgi:hypothetical protein
VPTSWLALHALDRLRYAPRPQLDDAAIGSAVERRQLTWELVRTLATAVDEE